jgi:succinoglycan biosynthesis transport protein ExoP
MGDWRAATVTDNETGIVTLPAAAPEAGAGDLSGAAMQKVLNEARGQFDYVIIDLPALGMVIDALAVLPLTDGSILVTEWGKTPRRLLTGLMEREPELADYIAGVVLNNVDLNALPKFTDAGGLERFAYNAEQRMEAAPN